MPELDALLDHLFRRESGRMVATLGYIFGARHIALAEEVVQEALVRALQLWPHQGIPDNPRAWLIRVARRLALDRLRREQSLGAKLPELERRMGNAEAVTAPERVEEHLAMMFLCCHPALPPQSRVALTLKVAAGFSVSEIARAFLASEETIAQRIVRAKRHIRDENLAIELPEESALGARLDSVLEALYLLFNEGYSASAGDSLLRAELCEEAIYLTSLLTARPATDQPKVHALLALQLFLAARAEARTNGGGDLLILEEQDRSLWDQEVITRAFHHLDRSAGGEELTPYHVQAMIASEHAAARSLQETDWAHIVSLYDQLLSLSPAPVVSLNRAVALSYRDNAGAGLEALRAIDATPAMSSYGLRHAVEASFLQRLGRLADAAASYEKALECRLNEPERRLLERRLQNLNTREVHTDS